MKNFCCLSQHERAIYLFQMYIEDNLTLITTLIERGDIIFIRTDGIWGLACDATNRSAIKRITSSLSPDANVVEEIIVAELIRFIGHKKINKVKRKNSE